VYFQFGTHAIYKFGASDPRYQHLRANNRIMWQAICRLQKEGFRELSFGRTDIEDEGLLQFKRGWGAEESPLRYYRKSFSKDASATKPQVKHEGAGWSRHIMRRLPIPVLRVLGTLMYRHVA
jgi:lipid II:glycine glycyltransferase (peptidoglycan interpeptide bridge formation enzyme)